MFTVSEFPPLVYLDLVCYIGLTIIGIIEIYLLEKKMSKEKKLIIRKRAGFGFWIIIYCYWVVAIFLLLIIHTLF